MEPFTEHFDQSITQVRNDLLHVLKEKSIELLGRNDDLELVSFVKDNNFFYAHLIGTENDKTKIAIAPGLSYMKDRDSNEMPPIIEEIVNEMKNSNNRPKA